MATIDPELATIYREDRHRLREALVGLLCVISVRNGAVSVRAEMPGTALNAVTQAEEAVLSVPEEARLAVSCAGRCGAVLSFFQDDTAKLAACGWVLDAQERKWKCPTCWRR